MKPIKHLAKINSKKTKELKKTTNDQSRIRADHEYQKMIIIGLSKKNHKVLVHK